MSQSPNAYGAYGLTFVTDRPLDGLLPTANDGPRIPVRLHSSRPPPFPIDSVLLIERDMGNGLTASVRRSSDNRETYCQYADGVVFRIGSAPVEVDGWWPSDEYIPQAATYLLGSVAGLVLQNLDAVCLHASTVNIDGFAVAFVGPPGTGKSTTAAALLRRGHSIITDDVAVIDEADGQPYVRRGYARLNLLDDAANALFLDSPQLTRSTRANGDDGKWMLNLNANSQLSSTTSVPLLAVYTGSGQMVESHRIVRYKPLDASLLLLANTFASYATTSAAKARHFDCFTRLAERISVSHIYGPQDLDLIDSLCETIEADVAMLRAQHHG